jgi:hypothetical protein
MGGKVGFGGAAATDVAAEGPEDSFGPSGGGGGTGAFNPPGGGGSDGFKAEDGAGTFEGANGRGDQVPPAGGKGFGPEDGGRKSLADGLAPPRGLGGRLGKLIRAVSFSVGRGGVDGGSVIRTVSFFGSFKSAIRTTIKILSRAKTAMCLANRARTVNH